MLPRPTRNWPKLCALGLTVAALPALTRAAGEPAFPNSEDLRHFRSMNDPRLSPDGKSVLVRITDSTAEGAKSHLWIVDIGTNSSRQLTYSPDSDKTGESRGEWMPDGRGILFTAHRGEHTNLYRLPMDGGEAKPFDLKVQPTVDESKLPRALPPPPEQKTEDVKKSDPGELLPIDVGSYSIASDGKTIAIIARDPQTPGEKKQADAKADAHWADHNPHGSRLYLLRVDTGKLEPVAIPNDVHAAQWSPDGGRLFAIREQPNGASDLSPAASGWLVDVSAPETPSKLEGIPATVGGAGWSSDGKVLNLLAQAEADAPPGYRDLYCYPLANHRAQNMSNGFKGSIGFQEPIATKTGELLQPVNVGVTGTLARFQASCAGTVPKLLQFPVPLAGSFHTNADQNGWVFLGNAPGHPVVLYYTADLSQPARPLNTPSLVPEHSRSIEPKRIHWKSDALTIEGLLYLPPEAAVRKVPLIVQVHGGPTGAYVDSYNPFINFLLGHGWAVLRSNPRGSTNYGAAFAAANKNDLGGGDYRDIMAGLDYVLKTESIDPDRLALEGYSYGGEMAGFAEGKTSRFKAIISGAPVIDQYSEYGTEGDSWYDRWFYGKPWEHPLDAWRQSPLSGVGHASTPFLLLQGETDTTDPAGQSQEMYRALKQAGVPVELVTYPRENHGPLANGIYGNPSPEPWHGFDARQHIVDFLQKAFGEASESASK